MNYYYGNYVVIKEYQFVVEVNDNNISIARVCYVSCPELLVRSQNICFPPEVLSSSESKHI